MESTFFRGAGKMHIGVTEAGQPASNFQVGMSYSQYEPPSDSPLNIFFLDFGMQAAVIPDALEFGVLLSVDSNSPGFASVPNWYAGLASDAVGR